MKPYFQQGAIRIYHGDCREVVGAIDVSNVGCAIADPPYQETKLKWDRWPEEWPMAMWVLPTDASLWSFGSLRMFMARAAAFEEWIYGQDVVWEKHNGSNSAADRFRRVHELAAQFYRGSWGNVWNQPIKTMDAQRRTVRRTKGRPRHWGELGAANYISKDGGPRLMRSVIRVRSEHGRALHPTQKPIGLVEPLVRSSLAPGRTLLEPFMGSGTGLVVAKSLGRAAIGIDINERWCEVAANRVVQEIGA